MTDVQRVRVVAPDGIELDTVVHRPASGPGADGSRGTVLLVHGICADLDEGGAFMRLAQRLARLVLWNPVLDLRRTFLEPELPWGVANFGPGPVKGLAEHGELLIGGRFALGRVLFAELAAHRPVDAFTAGGPPALVLHGDRDDCVSFDIARDVAATLPHWEFRPLPGAGHGFHSPEHESEAISVTARWLARGMTAQGGTA
ncbi:alpha/beta hydrolase [Streptomyces sp. CBMA29]|uniref:alpha/beta hydrolase n=1 Tax=Streptomyces sp. CBMA29 TaxID=1896314 RepID=UPI001CB73416|nr:S9 family peptidase [Streptomyces sp. CBMA29]MBD0738110.1 hypothetical protein [Streptomyces sp. CBMA29]